MTACGMTRALQTANAHREGASFPHEDTRRDERYKRKEARRLGRYGCPCSSAYAPKEFVRLQPTISEGIKRMQIHKDSNLFGRAGATERAKERHYAANAVRRIIYLDDTRCGVGMNRSCENVNGMEAHVVTAFVDVLAEITSANRQSLEAVME